jgi:hypothetical protein
MPSLKDSLHTNLPGFKPEKPALPPPPTSLAGKGNFSTNPSIRCPLPPFNVNVDTLRQFDQSEGAGPKRRVIPLPISTSIGNGIVVQKAVAISTGSSGGSSSTTATLTAKTVVFTSPLVAPGVSSFQAINMSSKSFQLITAIANGPCEVRIYGSAIAQAIDASRPTDAPLAAELGNNMITDVVLDTAPFTWNWQNRVGANSNTPQTTSIYITVTNLGMGTAAPQVTFVFLPLESL